MKRALAYCFLAAGLLSLPAAAAVKGSCESAADEVSAKGAKKRIVLVNEYNEQTGAYTGNGLYVLKMKLARGNSYTVWVEDVPEESGLQIQSVLAADPEDEDSHAPEADFEEVAVSDTQVRHVLYASDWNLGLADPDDDKEDIEDAKEDQDPKNWWYYITIEGDIGESCTLCVQQGINLPKGIPENPYQFYPGGSVARTGALKFPTDSSEFCFTVRMLAGRRYLLSTLDGTEELPLGIESITGGEFAEHPSWYSNEWNMACHFVPEETDLYDFSVITSVSNALAPFRLQYVMLPVRSISKHELAGQLTPGDVVSAKPGRKNAFGDVCYDEIIDEALYSFKAMKGTRYLLRTTGATTNLLLRVYDSKGNIVVENRGRNDGTFDVLGGLEASVNGVYYVGVCQDLAETAELADLTIDLSLEVVTGVEGSPDAWDARDDTSTGASLLSPVVCQSTNELSAGVEVVDVKGHGPHRLSAQDWYDTFAIAVRKDVVYCFKVTFPGEQTHLTLRPRVYSLAALSGSYSPNTAGDINAGTEGYFSFKATANGTYYLQLSVAEGVGLDYPEYILHAAAHGLDGIELGTLKVNTRGTRDGLWSIDTESVARYADGAVIQIAGEHTVRFWDIKGFNKPKVQRVVVTPGSGITEIDGYYSDTSDPKDDAAKGAVSWAL
ncbi:MAG: PPC domain-containing protein, partial [Kiritimatiellia bacterium]